MDEGNTDSPTVSDAPESSDVHHNHHHENAIVDGDDDDDEDSRGSTDLVIDEKLDDYHAPNSEERITPNPNDERQMVIEIDADDNMPNHSEAHGNPSDVAKANMNENLLQQRSPAVNDRAESDSEHSSAPATDENEDEEEVFHNKECVNYECSNTNKNYYRAPNFILNAYKVQKKEGKMQYICESCYDKACQIYEEFAGLLKNGQPLLLKTRGVARPELVEIDSSDESDTNMEGSEFSECTLKMIENELDNSVQRVLKEVEIQKQLTWAKSILVTRLEKLEVATTEVANELNSLQKRGDKMHSSLYRWPRPRLEHAVPLDLNTNRPYMLREGDIPALGEVTRPPVRLYDTYYAVKNKPIASWVPCKVIEEIESSQSKMYKVKYLRSQYHLVKTLSAKHLAFYDPPEVRLNNGDRVIAYFDATSLARGKEKISIQSAYYPGIIAETLKYCNNFRYLIFYDDGYTQYVNPKDVRLVCQVSENVWDDVHFGSRDFIQKYLLEQQQNRPMVQTQKGQLIQTEYLGKWVQARVLEVDCSLILIQFDESPRNHREWIYRGSMRLLPVFKEFQKKNSKPVARMPKSSETYIRYTKDDEIITRDTSVAKDSSASPAPRAVAKKSGSKQSTVQRVQSTAPYARPPAAQAPVHLNNSTIYVDDESQPKGKVVFYTAVRSHTPRRFVPHACTFKCLFQVPHKLHLYNPLAKPMLCGWERLLYRMPRSTRRTICYRGPCGRIMRNMKELHRYLRLTACALNVDNFSFSPVVHCLNEYVIENSIIHKSDISGGKEKMPIPLVNYYDKTLPPDCKYSAQRIPTEGVNLNLDPEFLAGCDCEDDCSDKSKCSCWQLTLAGAKYGNPNTPIDKVGYQYKRLLEHVPTGIYECNANCKCKSNCLNRVVQHSLQVKLQVFKTSNRGWGLRCLNDIAQGTFVCIYAGYLLTEAKANEGGKAIGDEYFAELDYIETVEQIKEGYESDVEQLDSEDDEENLTPDQDNDDDDFTPGKIYVARTKKAQRQTRSSLSTQFDEDSQERQVLNFDPQSEMNDDNQKENSIRKLFGKDEHCYVMDAKITGNLGRYFNHSCEPNLFVQNVFVDTHDLRFPWVAFFASADIRSGTELTWNYNYEVGVVPGKVLYCQCGTPNCRVRLL